MNRIRRGYELQFRRALGAAGARRMDEAVRWLFARGTRLASEELIPLTTALARVEQRLHQRCFRAGRKPDAASATHPPLFWCDAGLGGLARWLRAAGYVAHWQAQIDDAALLERAVASRALVLTTDSLLLERRLVARGDVPVLWLPPTGRVPEQLERVLQRWNLGLLAPRCMNCSGELQRADKEALRERIPPRTYRWRDEYFLCGGCGQLFWRGTHWQRIQRQLDAIATKENRAACPKPP